MKIAVCLSGEPRGLRITHESLRETITNFCEDHDIFGFLPETPISDQLEKYFPEAHIAIEKDKQIDESKVPPHQRFKTGPQPFLQQINGWKRVNLMRKEHEEKTGKVYDFVVRARMDVMFTSALPDINNFKKEYIYIPNFHHHGGLNDRFCVATPDHIDKYMNIIDFYHSHPYTFSHAESFLASCLSLQNAKVAMLENFRFARVREDGNISENDLTDK